ncbi:hypothetical protein BCR42DRAFT_402095 [Absidia repens]|uniref:C3H1-type domain-containing protein n=1 Tax=Absidia repens TaxID=90262 RepID=A0A1X2IXH5_9FUNG|nr:hypothetical protein BCR42DRAFT_402095 [Absidia repens]
MTDPSRFQAHWKTPFFFNPRDKTSNDLQQCFILPQATDTNSSSRSSPIHSPIPHLPSSPYHHHLHQTKSCSSFQPFDPFDTHSTLDDSTTTTTTDINKDAELDQLSTLLSKQFLEDVDAETLPPSLPTTTTKTTSPINSTPNARMLGSFTNSISSPWALDDDATGAFRQPWSPALSSSGHLPSPTITTKEHTTDNGSVSAVQQWDRFEPYGNDSEFDPTLTFYQGGDQANSLSTTTTTMTSNHNSSSSISSSNSNSNIGHGNQQDNFNMMTVALRKLSLLFPDHDEKELERTLATLDFDVEQTIEALSPGSASTTAAAYTNIPAPGLVLAATSISAAPATATAEKVHLMKLPATTTPHSTTSTNNINNNNNNINNNEQQSSMLPNGTVRKRQVCRHYLAGECYRKDCWFAHDLEVKPCKFWLQGLCLKGDTCEFAHSLEELEQVAKNHHPSSSPSSSSPSNNNNHHHHSSPTLNSHHHHHHHHHQQQQYHQEQSLQQQPYTSPTVADFPILLARSKRKSKKKSHNKKIKT